MKRIAKIMITVLLCLVIACTALVPSFAASGVGQVTGAKATKATYNSATLTWKAVSGAAGYEVEQANGSKWTSLNSKVTGTSLALTKLSTGTTYKYRIRAYKTGLFNRKTYGDYSATITVKPVLSKPTKLKATSTSTTSTKLTWAKVSGATGYYVQKYANKKWSTVKTLNAKTTSYTVSKLKLGTSYKYRVIAYIKVGNKNVQSAAASISFKASVPTPASFKASSITSTSAKLSWKKVSDANGYVIEQYNGKKWKTAYTIKKNSTVSKAIKIVPGTNYQYRIKAYKTVGKKNYYSAVSSTVSVKYTVNPAKSLKASSTNASSVTLSWAAAKSVSGYSVQQYVSNAWKELGKTTGTTYKASIVPNATYKFRVVSYLTVNKKTYNAAASNELSVKYTVPAVGGLKTTSVTFEKAVISWNAVSGAASYTVQQQSGSSWNTVATVKTNTYTAAIVPNTAYKYRVTANVTVGGKTYSGAASSVLSVAYNVAAPTNLKVTSATTSSVTLSWTGTANAAGYIVYQSSGSGWTQLKDLSDKTFTVDSLEAGKTYSFKVVAYETAKKYQSANAATGTFRTITATPEAPYVTGLSETSATFSWAEVTGADGYTVYKSDDMSTWTEYTSSSTNSATVTGLDASKTYGICVAAYHTTNGSKMHSAKSSSTNFSINAEKVAYANAVATAINNTKYDSGNVKVTADEIFESEIRNGKAKSDLLKTIPHPISKFPFVEFTDTWNITELMAEFDIDKELSEDLNSETTYSCDFSSCYGIYTIRDVRKLRDKDGNYLKDENGNYITEEYDNRIGTTLSNFIEPKGKNAYVYNEGNLTAAGKAFRNVSVSTDGDTTTIILTLAPESASSKDTGLVAPYHSCLSATIANQLSDFSSIEDGMSGEATATVGNKVTVGGKNYNGTTIKAVINKNGTLDLYDSISPFSLNTIATLDIGVSPLAINITFDGITRYTYTIDR